MVSAVNGAGISPLRQELYTVTKAYARRQAEEEAAAKRNQVEKAKQALKENPNVLSILDAKKKKKRQEKKAQEQAARLARSQKYLSKEDLQLLQEQKKEQKLLEQGKGRSQLPGSSGENSEKGKTEQRHMPPDKSKLRQIPKQPAQRSKARRSL